MKICSIDEIVNQNFNIVFLNALQQYWLNTKFFQCIGAPKKQNLFLYVNKCKISYTDKDGRTFVAEDGDIVYTPIGSEYKAVLSDFCDTESHTVGINFFLFDECGEEFILSDDIKIFHSSKNEIISSFFYQSIDDTLKPYTKNRILLMEILCALAQNSQNRSADNISRALSYLSEHIDENPTVAHLARLCNVSEVYFRRQFKAMTGSSPAKYRSVLRMSKAKSYLEFGDISVQEISDALGFSTVSYFIDEFKAHYGCSPLQYRKRKR